jgi:hypothetical protein
MSMKKGNRLREAEQKAYEKVKQLEDRLDCHLHQNEETARLEEKLQEARAELRRITFFTRDAAAKGAA